MERGSKVAKDHDYIEGAGEWYITTSFEYQNYGLTTDPQGDDGSPCVVLKKKADGRVRFSRFRDSEILEKNNIIVFNDGNLRTTLSYWSIRNVSSDHALVTVTDDVDQASLFNMSNIDGNIWKINYVEGTSEHPLGADKDKHLGIGFTPTLFTLT